MTPQILPTEYTASLERFCDAVLAANKSVAPYTRHYLGARRNALINTYPAVRAALGPAMFDALGSVYVSHYPPVGWDLNLYGEQFSEFALAQLQGRAADQFNWRLLATVARIEYAITATYYADDPAPSSHAQPDQPGHQPRQQLEPDKELRATWDCTELARLHRFVEVAPHLVLDRPIAIWRESLRVRLDHQVCRKPLILQRALLSAGPE